MKLKLDDAGKVVVQDGKPVFVHDDGKEVAADVPDLINRIEARNTEAKMHRKAKEEAEAKLKAFEGIEDAEVARRALETIKNIKDGELITAGKVQEIKDAAKKAAEEQVAAAHKAHAEKLTAAERERDGFKSDLHKEKVGGFFLRSKYITEKVAIPAEFMQARFGDHFEVKEGRTVAKYTDGSPIYSRTKPGEIAEPEEAIEILVEASPHKDHILKGAVGDGSGARPASGGMVGGKDISKLSPVERMNAVRSQQANR